MIGTAKAAYNRLASKRDQALEAARGSASLTLVTMVPMFEDEDDAENGTRDRLVSPHQLTGAAGVNSLSAKITLAWLPPSQSFVRLKISSTDLAQSGEENRTKIEGELLEIEKMIMDEVEDRKVRPAFHQCVKHLIVAGNVCLRLFPGKDARVFPLSSYVNDWDDEDNLIELILRERMAWATLTPDLQALVSDAEPGDYKAEDTVLVHTWVKRKGNKYETRQEIGNSGVVVPKSERSYPLDELPYAVLRWATNPGQPYGFGLIEEYGGSIQTLEALTEAVVDGAVAAAKMILMVDPNGFTELKDLQDAENLAIIHGKEDEARFLKADKQADMSVAAAEAADLRRELSKIFLLNSAVTRNAERVTAEEIRLLQLELDTALGGVFASLGQSFSLWLVKVIIRELRRKGQIPKLSKAIKPAIVTGIEALGRGHEVNRIAQFVGTLTSLGIPLPEAGIKPQVLTKMLAVGHGIPIDELLLSDEEIQARQQQQNVQQLVDSVGSAAISSGALQEGEAQE